MEKYYLNKDASHDIVSGDYSFHFEQVCMIATSYWGVYKTSDEGEQAALEKLFTSGVKAISPEDYAIYIKKKKTSMTSHLLQGQTQSTTQLHQQAKDAPVHAVTEHGIDEVSATSVTTAGMFVNNKDDLASALGFKATDKSFKALWDAQGAPAKTDSGYDVGAWKVFAGHANA